MNIYNNKKRWKLLLIASAAVAFLIIIYYSNMLISNVAHEEQRRVELWADAISYKAELVNYTEKFFETIRTEEGKKAAIFAQALQKANEASWDEDITFYQNIISSNTTIPSIVAQADGKIDWAINVSPEIAKMKNIAELGDRMAEYESVKIQYYKNQYIIVYYKESQIYTNLRIILDNLIHSFFQEIVINSASVPVIVTDSTEKVIIAYGNLDSALIYNPVELPGIIDRMRSAHTPIKIVLPDDRTCYVFYEDSSVLKQLRIFPFLQFFIVFLFGIIAYFLFSIARKSEQNQVWVGMSKETAHQLGTPISSLMAWNELLKEQQVDNSIITEIDKDIHRLETIALRFSKIGSVPELKEENLILILEEFITYLQTRISSKVQIILNKPVSGDVILPLNRYLFEWVIENLCKNAVDAMDGCGKITITIIEDENVVHIDIADTGKGIPQKKQKTIFQPGFTSKNRGWGLGLTLAKRIIKEYHKGKLFVKSSLQEKGTVMRITLKRYYKQ